MPPSITAPPLRVPLEPLTQAAFAPFGTVIESPLGAPLPTEGTRLPALPRNSVLANQGTAIKHLDVSSLAHYYAAAPSKQPARAVMNMFSCVARALRDDETGRRVVGPMTAAQTLLVEGVGVGKRAVLLDVGILERHPFTPQTFVPVGLDAADAECCFLVVVAPTLPLAGRDGPQQQQQQPGGSGPPDVVRLRAFLARGSQAVTYAAGTWHAPMLVLGTRGVDFVVVQFANGVADEDCQEMLLVPEAGQSQGASVVVELPANSPLRDADARAGLDKPKSRL